MPLITGKSDKSFSKNVETEMDAGKPQKQSLAIAYAMKKKAEDKMAMGGECSAHGETACKMCHGGGYDEGGDVDDSPDDSGNVNADTGGGGVSGFTKGLGGQFGAKSSGGGGGGKMSMLPMLAAAMADGGEVESDPPVDPNDKRAAMQASMRKAFHYPGYAEGGEVEDERDETPNTTDEQPNDFELEPEGMEFSESGDEDEIGDAEIDKEDLLALMKAHMMKKMKG